MSSAAERYARDVVGGRVPACRTMGLAADRMLRDLRDGPARGLRFDKVAASRACRFFEFLRQSKGEWAGLPIALQPWQRFGLENTFGWRRANGTRRFRVSYWEIPRKNGKTTLAAGVALYLLVADGEPGAEVYSAATARDQARISFREAKSMVLASPELAPHVHVLAHNLSVPNTGSAFQALSSDSNRLDGLNPHGAICDELHAWPSRDLWDVIETGMGSRRQPLMFAITTAGHEIESICGEYHELAVSVLNGALEDDELFALVTSIDHESEWADPAGWAKANPNLGVSLKRDYLEGKVKKALNSPASAPGIKRLNFNLWFAAREAYLPLETWRANPGPIPAVEILAAMRQPDPRTGLRRPVYAGLDLASSIDLAALAFACEWEPETVLAAVHFYMPRDRAEDPESRRRDRVPYPTWCSEGWITATPGTVIDKQVIRRDLLAAVGELDLREVAYDPWNAVDLVEQLEHDDGLTVVPIRQGFASLSAPTKYLAELVTAGRLWHGGNPVLTWHAANLAVADDAAGNVKPDKKRSRQRIDGAVALICALDRVYRHRAPENVLSVYASRGIAS